MIIIKPLRMFHGLGALICSTSFLIGAALPASAATTLVSMVGLTFSPPTSTINAGDTVLWTNTSTLIAHNVVSSNGVWTTPPLFTSPGTFSHTFNAGGTFGYYCSVHLLSGMTGEITVRAPNQPPVINLTNPPSGSAFSAPADITLQASASDPDGSVTNVQFFSGTTLLASKPASPYSFTMTNLSAGDYNFTAKATDNLGLSRTSSVVAVSVITPGPISFDSHLAPVNGDLPLNVNVTPRLSYAIDYSLDLNAWLLFTNFVATNSVMNFSSPTTPDSHRLFRARLLPNP